MIKRLCVFACLFFSIVSVSQESTSSPYSFYGLGDSRFEGSIDNRSMGGVSVFSDSIHINLQNPAFYSHLRLTTFSIGGSFMTTTYKTNDQKERARRAALDYLAIGIPMGKWGAGFGLMPYTAVGYKIRTTNFEGVETERRYSGTGGLNRAFLGLSYEFSPSFSAGLEAGYIFGDIETSAIYLADVQYGTRELNESAASGIGFTAGLAYKSKIGADLQFSAAASYSPEATISLSNERTFALVQVLTSEAINVYDEVDAEAPDTEVKLPSKITFGAGIGKPRKWMVGTEVHFIETSRMTNRFSDIEGAEFENGARYAVGGYFVPNFASYANYFKRITYRGGLKYEKTGLVINNRSINDAGFTLGVGLPLSGTFSNINLGFEFGKRGTRDAALVEEKYANFSVGLSLNDRWFVKRRYD